MKKKPTYYRVEVFAVGDLGGGCWEEDELVSGNTPEEAYTAALSYLSDIGYAFESKITVCDEKGRDLQ
jgi:hypothetical protein